MAIKNNIRLIIGLGNSGNQYIGTRHNIGKYFLDVLSNELNFTFIKGKQFNFSTIQKKSLGCKIWVLYPNTFMNESGKVIDIFMKFYKIIPEEILVIHDEMNLPCGMIRLKLGGGDNGHRGLKSIEKYLGTNKYSRLRIGIDHPGEQIKVIKYVLSKPSATDKISINFAIKRAISFLGYIIKGDHGKFMNEVHGRIKHI